MNKALYRHKSKKSAMMSRKQRERHLIELTKKLDPVEMRAKYFATSYGRQVQKAMDNGASFINALRLATLLIRNQPSFGMRRNIYGKISKGDA